MCCSSSHIFEKYRVFINFLSRRVPDVGYPGTPSQELPGALAHAQKCLKN